MKLRKFNIPAIEAVADLDNYTCTSTFHIILHTGIRFEFTEPVYYTSESVGSAEVAITVIGSASRNIMVTVISTDDSAIGK